MHQRGIFRRKGAPEGWAGFAIYDSKGRLIGRPEVLEDELDDQWWADQHAWLDRRDPVRLRLLA